MSVCDILPNFMHKQGFVDYCYTCKPGDSMALVDSRMNTYLCKHVKGSDPSDKNYYYDLTESSDCGNQRKCAWLYSMTLGLAMCALYYKYGKYGKRV